MAGARHPGQFAEMTATAIGAHSYMHKTKVSRAVRALAKRRGLKRRKCRCCHRARPALLFGPGLQGGQRAGSPRSKTAMPKREAVDPMLPSGAKEFCIAP